MARPLFVKNSNASWAQASDYNINNGSWTRGKLIYVKTENGWEHEHEYQNFRETSVANCVDEQEYVYDCPCYETGAYSNTYYGTTNPDNHKGGYSYIGAVNYDTTYHTKKYKCVACGQAAPAQDSLEVHTASSAWTYDSSKHWHACTAACGAKLNEANHVAAENMTWDTSDHWYPCTSNCGIKLSQAAHDYYPMSYGVDVNDPDNYHWSQQDCKVCDYTNQVERLPHTLISSYNTYLDLTHLTTTWCELCGHYTKVDEVEPHEFGSYFYDNIEHWKKCEQCESEGNTRGTHNKSTYGTFSGKLDYDIHTWYCTTSGCDWEKQEAHTLTWNSNSSQHWKQCEVCGAGTGANGNDSNYFPLTTPVAHDNPVSSYLDQSTTGHYRLTICSTCDGTMFDTWEDHTPDYSTWLSNDDEHWRKCSGCGYEKIQAAPHRDPGAWESQANYHYKYCADGCGQFYAREEHIESGWKNDNPEGHYKECTVCEYEMVAPQPHYGEWMTNSISHWKNCTICEYPIYQSESHEDIDGWETDSVDHWKVCRVCGYRTGNYIPHDATWGRDSYNHWKYCSVCEYPISGPEAHSGSYDFNDSQHWIYCTCGYVIESPTGHTPGAWEYSSSFHWKRCSICDCQTNYEGHSTPSTWNYTDSSYHYKKCSDGCGYTISSGAHTPSWDYDSSNHWKACNSCGYVTVSTTGHSLSLSSYDDDYEYYSCECGYSPSFTHSTSYTGWYVTLGTYHTQQCGNSSCGAYPMHEAGTRPDICQLCYQMQKG